MTESSEHEQLNQWNMNKHIWLWKYNKKRMDKKPQSTNTQPKETLWLPVPKSILQLQVAATWRTDFSSWVGLFSLPEIGSEMWNHADEIWRGFLVASGCLSFLLRERQTFSSLQNIQFLLGNRHTTTRKILPWYKASIVDDGVEQCKESESLVSPLKYWIAKPKAHYASGLPVLLS